MFKRITAFMSILSFLMVTSLAFGQAGVAFPVSSITLNGGGATLTTDFLEEVQLGNVTGYSLGFKFGRNEEIDTTTDPEDVWEGGGNYTGQPVSFTPETVDVRSTSTDDTSDGTGARIIRIVGLKSNISTAYESEDITLNGTSDVVSSNTWWRVNRAYVLTAGSGAGNAGVITVESSTTSANVFVSMPIGYNQTQIAALTVPAESTMLIKMLRIGITRASGAAGSANVTLRAREEGSVYRALRNVEVQTGEGFILDHNGGILLDEGTDIKVRVESVSDNDTIVDASFEYLLIAD